MPATSNPNTHVESIPPNPNAWFVINTSTYYQGVHRSAANNPNPSPQGTPASATVSALVNQYFAFANPA